MASNYQKYSLVKNWWQKYKWSVITPTTGKSVEVNKPLLAAEAFGKLKVWVVPTELMLKLVPKVPMAKVWAVVLNPFKLVMPPPATPRLSHIVPFQY
jgi:hypothetical protein